MHPCVCVCARNSESYLCMYMTLVYTVLYENISDKFDNGHSRVKVEVTVGLLKFHLPHLLQYKLSGLITQL